MLGEAIAHPSSVKRFFPIRPNQGRRIVHGAEARVFARAQAHVDAPVRHLLVADDQDVGDFCQLRLADLEAQLFVAQVRFNPDARALRRALTSLTYSA